MDGGRVSRGGGDNPHYVDHTIARRVVQMKDG